MTSYAQTYFVNKVSAMFVLGDCIVDTGVIPLPLPSGSVYSPKDPLASPCDMGKLQVLTISWATQDILSLQSCLRNDDASSGPPEHLLGLSTLQKKREEERHYCCYLCGQENWQRLGQI